jgi:hypothetical protein
VHAGPARADLAAERALLDGATPERAASGPVDPRAALLARVRELSASRPRAIVASSADDARWADDFGLPVVDGRVWDFAEYHGELIVGGYFRQIGGGIVNYVARWDGTAWHSLGGGLDGPVRTLEVIGDNLYAGGAFTSAGSVSAEGLACWNGTSWSGVGSGLHGTVDAIAPYGTGLAVGGDLTLGSASVDVAQWDGLQWTSLLSGLQGSVNDLASFEGRLVAAGSFVRHDGAPLPHVATFDGASWTALGGGIDGAQIVPQLVTVMSMTVYGGSLWLAGVFDQVGGQPASNVARWNGAAWDTAGALFGIPVGLRAVGGVLYACGSLGADSLEPGLVTGVRAWSDTGWAYLTRIARQPVYALGGYHDTLVVSGVPGIPYEDVLVLRDRGWRALHGDWRPQDRGVAGRNVPDVRALLPTGSDLFVAGTFVAAGSVTGLIDAPSFAHSPRHRLAWYVEPLATDFEGDVYALCEYNGAIVVGGLFSAAPSFPTDRVSNIAFWDGTGWQDLGGGIDGIVYSLAVFHGELYAGGFFTRAGGAAVNGLARWNGSQWLPVGPVNSNETVVYSLFPDADTLWIGGSFTRMGGVVAANIAAWDGVAFRDVGFGARNSDLSGYVGTMTRHDHRLVVAGDFTRAGTLEASRIAQWNGLEWESFGASTWRGFVHAMKDVGGTLWAGGQFYALGASEAFTLATWDGAAWQTPGSGVNGRVDAIVAVGDTVYVGGSFTVAGGKSSFGVARWDPLSPRAPGTRASVIDAAPNPMAGSATLAFTLPAAGTFELSIHDLGGRRRFATRGGAAPGPNRVTWDGRGSDGRLVPAGLYFMRLSVDGATRARGRIAVVR